MTDLQTLATFPFLHEAKQFVQHEGATVHELLTDPLFELARNNALGRVENVIDHYDVGNRVMTTDSDRIMELFSYPVARMITVCISDDFFTRRYALGEAVHMYKNLLNEELEFIVHIAKEFQLNINLDEDEQPYIHFTDYLTYAPTR